MVKIKMDNPVVEMDGDEMTRVLWGWIKELLIEPFVDLNVEYYDLGLEHRDETNNQVSYDAGYAIKKHKVGVKCATITPNAEQLEEFNLKELWVSPNKVVRTIVGGTIFRSPIVTSTQKSLIRTWKYPITIARHGYGDIYDSEAFYTKKGDVVEIVVKSKDGSEQVAAVHEYEDNGVFLSQMNLDTSIEGFARTCFKYAIDNKLDIVFGTKDTVTQAYDTRFKDIFEDVYQEYRQEMERLNLNYTYTLIDSAISAALKSDGNILWACKNYDGDLMSDMTSTLSGNVSMMSSVLQSTDGCYEYEAAHGTVARHYQRYLNGEETSTNPTALIFTWGSGLERRGILDSNDDLKEFGQKLKTMTLEVIDSGIVTKDMAGTSTAKDVRVVTSREFMLAIKERLDSVYN